MKLLITYILCMWLLVSFFLCSKQVLLAWHMFCQQSACSWMFLPILYHLEITCSLVKKRIAAMFLCYSLLDNDEPGLSVFFCVYLWLWCLCVDACLFVQTLICLQIGLFICLTVSLSWCLMFSAWGEDIK